MFCGCVVEMACLAGNPGKVEEDLSRMGCEGERKDVRWRVLRTVGTVEGACTRVADQDKRQIIRIA